MSKQKALLRIEEAKLNLSKYLDLSDLELIEIPSELIQLDRLETLNLCNNRLTSISGINHLPNLKLVDFRGNNISEINAEFVQLDLPIKWKFDYQNRGLYLEGNPIKNVPLEIMNQGNKVIASYLKAVNRSRGKSINEIKVVLIGDGGVGKTSIVNRFINNVFDPSLSVTQGIDIRDFFIESEDRLTKIKFWDFGGQEIMHSTHQLFFTKRTIYLLVIDSRRENKIEYWLKSLISRVGQVPVFVVINKIDQNPTYAINEGFLRQKYPSIIAFSRISCLTYDGFNELFDLLKNEINKLRDTFIKLPNSWYQIKEELENSNYDYISYQYFQDICLKNGVNEIDSQNILSEFLHDIGVILHFKNLALYNTQILNPDWITGAIYKIINSNHIHIASGRFNLKDVELLLNDNSQKYPSDKIGFIIGVMREFELIFQLEKNLFVIPDLLPIEEPSIQFNLKDSIKFIFEYDFLPKDIFPKILVRLHSYIKHNTFWRTGVVLFYKDSEAIVRVDNEDKRIIILVFGDKRKEFFAIIRDITNKVNSMFPSLKLREMIPLPDSNIEIEYADLLGHKESGHKTYFSGVLKKEFHIDKLFNDIEQISNDEDRPIAAFISYSHNDHTLKNELINHLSPLVRMNKLKIWEDGEIDPGQIWEQEIMSKLEDAKIILCLISSDFIASDFCYSVELKNALDGHEKKTKVVVPIQLRECAWKMLPIGKIQGIPKIPISSSKNIDEAWTEVVEGINKCLLSINGNN